MKKLILLISLSIIPCFAHAEVQAMTIMTGRGDGSPAGVATSYTVPAGKVFIVESVQFYAPTAYQSGDVYVQFIIKPDNLDATRFSYVNIGEYVSYKYYSFDKPIRLRVGEGVGANATYGYYTWRGLLVDTTDLYAQLDLELDNPRIEDGMLLASTRVLSPRQYRLNVETSEDLARFAADTSTVVTPGSNSAENTVAVDVDPTGETFMRVAATARPRVD